MAIHGMDVPTSGASGSSKAPAASLPAAPRPGSSASCHRRHGDGPAVSGQNGEGNGWRYGDMDRYIYIYNIDIWRVYKTVYLIYI